MTAEGRRALASDELERALEEMRAADALVAAGMPRVAVTRIYFAVFHAMRARLYADDFEPRSHGGVQHLFNLHYVKAGAYPALTSRLTARLQKFREEADYGAAFVIDDEGAREELEAARAFVASIEADLVDRL